MIVVAFAALLILATIILAYILHSFPWALHKPIVYSVDLKLDDLPAVVISDLHIGSGRSGFREALRILLRIKPNTLIIAGDLIDESTVVGEPIARILRHFTVISRRVIYTPSTSSHDRAVKPIFMALDDNRVIVASPVLRICINELRKCFYVTHGDYALRSGVYAHIAEALSLRIFRKPFVGTILRRVLRTDDWIFYGHTHKALASETWMTVNTGCWVHRPHEAMQRALAIIGVKGKRLKVVLIKIE
ncbi:MAG: metallophosphoesterase [Ignisphaera sp.]|nr:metallophosphoesterase [Ignisphaera sp.]